MYFCEIYNIFVMILDTLDKSFLRLVTDFSVAKNEMIDCQYVYKESVVLSPSEKFLQISNSPTDISFNNNYNVSLVNCSNEVLLDITNNVFITEFVDKNGIKQIAYEISPIGVDFYYTRLFLRFQHTIDNFIIWSNAFICTNNVKSFRLDYKSHSYYAGTSYEVANYMQSIRIAGFYNLPSPKDSTKITTLINGDIRRSRPTQALIYSFNIDSSDTFLIDRLMFALNSELVFLNKTRFKLSESISVSERDGSVNDFKVNFKGQFQANEIYSTSYQIAPPLLGVYNPYEIIAFPLSDPFTASATFNSQLATVTNAQLFFNGSFLENLTVTIVNNTFTFQLTNVQKGDYYVLFTATNILGQSIIATPNTWFFEVALGEFDNLDFDNVEFFVN